MTPDYKHSSFTLLAGCLLGFMVFFNGLLAKYLNPLVGSFVVHIVGLVAALVLVLVWRQGLTSGTSKPTRTSYSTGVFGGLAVIAVGITVNSQIGIAGTVGLLVLGQVIYGWASDVFGLFGSQKRKLTRLDLIQCLCVLVGAGLLIYG